MSSLDSARIGPSFRYCYQAKWIERVPAWPSIKVDIVETQPLSAGEYERLLASVGKAVAAGDARRRTGKNNGRRSPDEEEQTARKVRAFLQCMRWTGLALRDAVTLPKAGLAFDEMQGVHRVTTQRVKTGTDVSVPIPPHVATEIQTVAAANFGPYVFWTGEGSLKAQRATGANGISFPFFKAAGLHGDCFMVSHRLRDTFAVHLLKHGIPMDEVSRLLGHRSIRTTEKHYAKWSRGRQDRVDGFVTKSWAVLKHKAR